MKIKKLLQNIFKKFFQLIFQTLYGKIKVISVNTEVKINKYPINKVLIKKKEYNIKNNIYKIQNGRVYTNLVEHVAIIKDNLILPDISYQQISGDLKDVNYNPVLKFGTPRIRKNFKGNVLSLVQGASGNNFFHFLFDVLPKIRLFQEKYDLNSVDYFYMPNVFSWQKKILSKFDISENKLINSQNFRHIKADNIFALDHPWYHKGNVQQEIINLPEWIIYYLREKFIKYSKKFKASDKIFIDRSDSSFGHCKLINNEDVMKYLSENGFQSFQVSKLDFFEQVYLFNNAKIIIGPHGAAFSNIIFSNPALELIEFIPKDHPSIKCKKISSILGFNYKRVNLEPLREKEINLKGDMQIEISQLRDIINSLK